MTAILSLVALCPQQVFWSWLVPMQIGVAWFAFTTVYLPHGRYAAWIMNHAPAITGFHDDHHKMPQYPWYQYFSMPKGLK